jgi:hypothetical protein
MRTEAYCSLRNIGINKIRTVDNVEKIYRFISTRVSSQKWNMQTDEHSFRIFVFSTHSIFYVLTVSNKILEFFKLEQQFKY